MTNTTNALAPSLAEAETLRDGAYANVLLWEKVAAASETSTIRYAHATDLDTLAIMRKRYADAQAVVTDLVRARISESDVVCRYVYTWHADSPEQRRYTRTAPAHDLEERRAAWLGTDADGGSLRITVCRRCGREVA